MTHQNEGENERKKEKRGMQDLEGDGKSRKGEERKSFASIMQKKYSRLEEGSSRTVHDKGLEVINYLMKLNL